MKLHYKICFFVIGIVAASWAVVIMVIRLSCLSFSYSVGECFNQLLTYPYTYVTISGILVSFAMLIIPTKRY